MKKRTRQSVSIFVVILVAVVPVAFAAALAWYFAGGAFARDVAADLRNILGMDVRVAAARKLSPLPARYELEGLVVSPRGSSTAVVEIDRIAVKFDDRDPQAAHVELDGASLRLGDQGLQRQLLDKLTNLLLNAGLMRVTAKSAGEREITVLIDGRGDPFVMRKLDDAGVSLGDDRTDVAFEGQIASEGAVEGVCALTSKGEFTFSLTLDRSGTDRLAPAVASALGETFGRMVRGYDGPSKLVLTESSREETFLRANSCWTCVPSTKRSVCPTSGSAP